MIVSCVWSRMRSRPVCSKPKGVWPSPRQCSRQSWLSRSQACRLSLLTCSSPSVQYVFNKITNYAKFLLKFEGGGEIGDKGEQLMMIRLLKNDPSIKLQYFDLAKFCSGKWYTAPGHKWHVASMYHRSSCQVIQNNWIIGNPAKVILSLSRSLSLISSTSPNSSAVTSPPRDMFKPLLGPSVVKASGPGGFLTTGQYLRPRLDLSRPGVEKTTGQGSHRRLIRTREA